MKIFLLLELFLITLVVSIPIENDDDFKMQPRIAGGEFAKPHQFPYQAGMKLTKFINDGIFSAWCGGSLISDQVILTAAHCLESTSGGTVYLGAHNRDEAKEADRITIKIRKENIIIHEKYDAFLHTDDIALIILPQKVKLNDKINIIRLSKSNDIKLEGQTAIASGWGKVGDGKPGSSVLRFVEQKIVSNDICMKNYGILAPSQLCVDTTGGKSTCQGDSGGPLVIKDKDGSNVLVGLTSYGKAKGCELGIPVIFTKVGAYIKWISQKSGIQI